LDLPRFAGYHFGNSKESVMTKLADIQNKMRDLHLADEVSLVSELTGYANLSVRDRGVIVDNAATLVEQIRGDKNPGMMEVFLAEYGLSNSEGIALMCLAEALLRVPDAQTMDDLIEDKLTDRGWAEHMGKSDSNLVNASTWALMLTGKVLDEAEEPGVFSAMRGLVKRVGEPVIRRAVRAAMKEMGNQFVLGENIKDAVKRGAKRKAEGYTFSYDMLGEAALTDSDARVFTKAYADAISHLAKHSKDKDVRNNPGISIKLSALFPRYELAHKDAVMDVLVKRLRDLVLLACEANMGLNIDAEEADRLDLSLDIIAAVLADPRLVGWDGFGVVVQAYGKRASAVLDYLYALSGDLDRKIMVRLVKGAYWDTEIKRAQVEAMVDFPVFTKKCATDISYLSCSRQLLNMADRIYPQFATHNAHSVHAVLQMAKGEKFEFQRLHGMGGALYDHVMAGRDIRCRIYAPVGVHDDLLAYLVRRLLENGANSSFVNKILDDETPARDVVADPFETWDEALREDVWVTKPADLYQPERRNSLGFDMNSVTEMARMDAARDAFRLTKWNVSAQLAKGKASGDVDTIVNPADAGDVLGTATRANAADAVQAISNAKPWGASQAERAAVLNRIADLYEDNFGELFAILSREAGKTLNDAISEIREAVDFLRYYAAQSVNFAGAEAQGKFVCISPWNFPLAIFTGQISAALATGNAVLAKPAEPTPIIATRAVELMYTAGVPRSALQLLIGTGTEVGATLVASPDIDGVCFTGSTATAMRINTSMAATGNPFAPLIAETGGLNAMIVDSTALPEQAVRDIVASSFQSAGQRCSALRMLYVQADVADKFLTMLYGAMDELVADTPWLAQVDLGPVITKDAANGIQTHIDVAARDGRVLHQSDVPEVSLFIRPTAIRVDGIADMKEEIFGPVLHIATFEAEDIPNIVDDINATGYGLTFGVHSRIDARVQELSSALNVGNIYVNRNQIGAVVGSQPFGGEGLSGTGPKAGGPDYLALFVQVEQGEQAPAKKAVLQVDNVQKLLDGTPRPERRALEIENLPGPTGELNILTSYAKGVILCLGPDAEQADKQAALVRETGCEPCIVLGMDLSDLASVTGFDAVILWADGDAVQTARRALAKRSGALIPLIIGTNIARRCVLERHVCIDTTAAGGNVALLAAGG
jgi:RHH-type proline utilization regulon transcriptional repressor/proline dehydrogenase/delta 1-pyrroline-5-carboxylate dehydrogenase